MLEILLCEEERIERAFSQIPPRTQHVDCYRTLGFTLRFLSPKS